MTDETNQLGGYGPMDAAAQVKIMRWPELRDSLVEAGSQISALQQEVSTALAALERARAALQRIAMLSSVDGDPPGLVGEIHAAAVTWTTDGATLAQAERDADTIHALRAQVLEGAALAVRSVDAERAAAAMAERARCLRIVREAPLAPDTKVGARQLDLKRRITEAIERGDG